MVLRRFCIIQRRVGNLQFRVIHGCCLFTSGGEYGYSARQAFPETRDLREHRDAHPGEHRGKLNSISNASTKTHEKRRRARSYSPNIVQHLGDCSLTNGPPTLRLGHPVRFLRHLSNMVKAQYVDITRIAQRELVTRATQVPSRNQAISASHDASHTHMPCSAVRYFCRHQGCSRAKRG
jgi:hypothetical protein